MLMLIKSVFGFFRLMSNAFQLYITYNFYLFAIRPYDLLYITPIDIRHKKHSRLRGGEKNERK